MRRHYRWVAAAATALLATAAFAAPASTNPLARGEQIGSFGPGLTDAFGNGPLDANALARPGTTVNVTPVTPVTPVPEPHEWMMLAAGIAMGLIVLRRGAWRR